MRQTHRSDWLDVLMLIAGLVLGLVLVFGLLLGGALLFVLFGWLDWLDWLDWSWPPKVERKMWILVLVWVAGGANLTASSIPNFESKAACEKAYNTLKADVSWGSNVNLVGTCVSAK
jgi:hypothetical protein